MTIDATKFKKSKLGDWVTWNSKLCPKCGHSTTHRQEYRWQHKVGSSVCEVCAGKDKDEQ